MEILGVGPLELLFILIIALIVLGPNDMVKAGRTLGRFMRKVIMSPTWGTVQKTSRELRQLPTRLMREAGIEEEELKRLQREMEIKAEMSALNDELQQIDANIQEGLSDWTGRPPTIATPPPPVAHPPASESAPDDDDTPASTDRPTSPPSEP